MYHRYSQGSVKFLAVYIGLRNFGKSVISIKPFILKQLL